MKKILCIEDTEEFQSFLVHVLQKFDVSIAGTLAEAKQKIEKSKWDLFLLDVQLPDGEGYELCEYIVFHTDQNDVPVVFLTSQGDVKDKLMGFELGAEDYIVKPVDPKELMARVEARFKIKRVKGNETVGKIEYGPLLVNVEEQFVEDNSIRLDLSPIEYKLVYFLIKAAGEVVTRAELMERVWGPNIRLVDKALDVHLSHVRKKLKKSRILIKAVYGQGYQIAECKT